MQDYTIVFDTFTNAFDSLKTANTVLDWEHKRKWKWFAISIHHALYMFCTNALHFGNYEVLLKKGSHPDKKLFLPRGEKYLKSSIRYVREGQPAYQITWEETEEEPPQKSKTDRSSDNGWLINIWSAIARVQDDVFWMNRMSYTESIDLTKNEWDALIFLTNKIRNELAHFVPRTYILHVNDFKINGAHIVNILDKLVNESYAIDYPIDDTEEWVQKTKQELETLSNRLNA